MTTVSSPGVDFPVFSKWPSITSVVTLGSRAMSVLQFDEGH